MKYKKENFETQIVNNSKPSTCSGFFYYDLVVKFYYRFL